MPLPQVTGATYDLVRAFEELLTANRIVLRQSIDTDITLGALLRAQAETARAILALVDGGYGPNALGLSRTVVENWIVIWWITNRDSDQRAKLFREFSAKQGHRITQLVERYFQDHDLTRFKINRRGEEIAHKYPTWHSWGPGLSAMAHEEEVLLEVALEGAASLAFTYDNAIFISSYYLHPTSLGLHRHFLTAGKALHFLPRREDEIVFKQAMEYVALYLSLSAYRVSVFWQTGSVDAAEHLWKQWVDQSRNENTQTERDSS